MFAQTLQAFGDIPAVVADDGRRLTYQELAYLADVLFAGDDRRALVAITCHNCIEALAVYLGALRAGAPALLLPPELDHGERERLLKRFAVSRAWDVETGWRMLVAPPAVLHADLALLLPTSGSIGAAKLVRLSYQNLQANAGSIALALGISGQERPVTVLPFHYSYGLSVVNSHLAAGATLLLTAAAVTARPFWDFLTQERASSLSGVPAIYRMLARLRFNPAEYPTLTTLTQAGGKLDDASLHYFETLCANTPCRFISMYGQTEATARISYLPPDQLRNKCGSIGIPIPGGRLSVLDEMQQVLTRPGMVGELRYEGPNVMLGYAETANCLARADDCGGMLLTGDIGYVDADGYYFIVGRKKRMLKLSGVRFSLDELEAALIDKGYAVALAGEDDQLCVYIDDSAQPIVDAAGLIRILAQQYRIHHSLVRVMHIPSLPRLPSGKIAYGQLIAQKKAG